MKSNLSIFLFPALFPFVVLIILFIFGMTLEVSVISIETDDSKLFSSDMIVDILLPFGLRTLKFSLIFGTDVELSSNTGGKSSFCKLDDSSSHSSITTFVVMKLSFLSLPGNLHFDLFQACCFINRMCINC